MPWKSRPVNISNAQQKELKKIAASKQSSGKEKCRALIVLLLGEGLKNKEIASRLNVHENTVVKWRGRWTGDNTESKVNDYGELTGRPRNVLVPENLERVNNAVKQSPPNNRPRWTVRSLAAKLDFPVATMQRALVELKIILDKDA
jgi:transposase